jgi:exodeoxyribonuclease VII small subunit
MSKSSHKPPKDFEEAMTELERIVADMEAGRTTLEDSLLKFERGSFLLEHCRKLLGAAEKKIASLSRTESESPGGNTEAAES